MSTFKVGDKVKFVSDVWGTDSVEEVASILFEKGIGRNDTLVVMETDYEGDGDVNVSVGGNSIWVYPWLLELVRSVDDEDVNILESKIRRAIDFLEVDWESVDIDRVLKLAKELI